MNITMYQASVPTFIKMLSSLSSIITKAENYATFKKIDETVLIQARLYPDMFPFVRQVQIMTDQAKGGPARLAGMTAPVFEDTESSFAELKDRIAKTIAFLNTLKADQIDGSENREITFAIREHQFNFTGMAYLTNWVLPNFYFHMTTAYDILRHNGIELGKRDFLGG